MACFILYINNTHDKRNVTSLAYQEQCCHITLPYNTANRECYKNDNIIHKDNKTVLEQKKIENKKN